MTEEYYDLPLDLTQEQIQLEDTLQLIRDAISENRGSIEYSEILPKIRESLNIGKLHKKRRDELFAQGKFRFDGTYIYDDLVTEKEIVEISTEKPTDTPKIDIITYKDTGKYPRLMDCGHHIWHWGFITKHHIVGKQVEYIQTGEEGCIQCLKGLPSRPNDRSGIYANLPIPLPYRATKDSIVRDGWRGYCCDKDGIYIGGISNDCRYTKSGEKNSRFINGQRVLCEAHKN